MSCPTIAALRKMASPKASFEDPGTWLGVGVGVGVGVAPGTNTALMRSGGDGRAEVRAGGTQSHLHQHVQANAPVLARLRLTPIWKRSWLRPRPAAWGGAAPSCLELRPASANQPLGPRWPAISALVSHRGQLRHM